MRNKFIIITVVFALMAFLLSPILWPDQPGTMMPGANLIPFFIVYGIFEAIAYGVGMAFLILYWKRFSSHRFVFLSVVWMLVSWWPHDNMHRTLAHDNFAGLLLLEYGFHATLIIAAIILARYLLQTVKK